MIIIALAAGLLIGFAATNAMYRFHLLRAPGGHGFVERLDRELHLTDQQREQIMRIMRGTHEKMDELHQEQRQKRRDVFQQSYNQIRATLTPEQQQKFDHDFPFTPPHWHHHHDDD